MNSHDIIIRVFQKSRSNLPIVLLATLFLGFSLRNCYCEEKSVANASESKVLAKVNDKELTLDEFYNRYSQSWEFRMGVASHGEAASNPYTVSGGRKRRFLDELITNEVLYDEAIKRGLDKDEEFLTMVEGYKRRLLTEVLLRNAENQVTVTDEEINDYYNSNKGEFVESEKIRVQQIAVKTEEMAKQILDELSKGADFGELAKKYSTDPFGEFGGDLGLFPLEKMPKRHRDIISKMNAGDVSEAMPVMGGIFRIVKLMERQPSKQLGLDEVKETIRQKLYEKKKKQATDDFVQALKTKAEITINYELLETKGGAEPKEIDTDTHP